MSGKDISEMSFDEFFFGKKPKREEPPRRAEGSPDKPQDPDIDGSRFVSGRPRLNVKGSSVLLYVPKYEGGRGARYDVSVEQDGRTVHLGRLKSSPLNSDVASIPTDFDILEAGIDPLKRSVLIIDGVRVYEFFDRTHMMFNADGIPISRADDQTYVLHRKGTYLWLNDAKVSTTREVGDLLIDGVEVARGGYVRVRDRPQPGSEPEKKDAKKAPAQKKEKASASISLPAPEAVASVVVGDRALPLYSSAPKVSVDIKGVEPDACIVKVEAPGRSDDVPGVSFGPKALEGASGEVKVSVVHDGKALASERFFVIPGFRCSYNGKGDFPSGTEIEFDLGSGPFKRGIDDLSDPYPFGDGEVTLALNIPVGTVDLGSGPVPIGDAEISADELPDSIIVTVRGASKKSVFLGGTGKKVNLTPGWEDETVRIDTKPIEDAVYSSPTRDAELYITVNSSPVRRFLRIRNDPGMAVSFSDGAVHASITGSAEYVCVIYDIDRTSREVPLQKGENAIPVGAGAISADVIERRNGKVLATETVPVKRIPFLLRDDMGDVWFYVSREKRIPLPDGLLEQKGNAAEIRKWHSQIVRMNPELKSVSPEMTVKAFKEFEA